MIRITAPHFVAGIIYRKGKLNICAPIIYYMQNWPLSKIFWYCRKKKWKYEEI